MNSKLTLTAVCFAAVFGAVEASHAAPAAKNNRCWGEIASGLAQFDSPNVTGEMNGGSMGMHSRSTQAANTNGGFASDQNAFGITFNVDGGRLGVGNVSKGAPHNTAPGDGGNGQHAVNNGEFFAPLLDPVTGTFMGGAGEPIECSLDLQQNIVP